MWGRIFGYVSLQNKGNIDGGVIVTIYHKWYNDGEEMKNDIGYCMWNSHIG